MTEPVGPVQLLLHRFGEAVDGLFTNPESSIRERMHELASHDDARSYIKALHDRFQSKVMEQEMEAASTGQLPMLDAMDRGQARALTMLFRLAFEMGRFDERREAADLNTLLDRLEG